MKEITELNNLLSQYVDQGFFPGVQWQCIVGGFPRNYLGDAVRAATQDSDEQQLVVVRDLEPRRCRTPALDEMAVRRRDT